MNDDVQQLDGFTVVAVDGKGVWVRHDASGAAWHVGGPSEQAEHALAEAYRSATN